MEERHDCLGDLPAVDEVVENHLRSGVLQELTTVVDNQQRVRLGGTEPSWQVDGHRTVALQSEAVHDELGEFAWFRVVVRKGPVWGDVAVREADRDGAKRTVRPL